jgi:hypothetical protein
MNKTKIKIGFITISDRAARGESPSRQKLDFANHLYLCKGLE